MLTIAQYEQWKAKKQANGIGAAQIVLGAMDDTPDAVAGDLNLASEFGKATGNPVPPLPLVKEHRSVFQQAVERERSRTVLSSSPRLTEWLRNPDNAALARDDLEGLSWWEQAGASTSNALERGDKRTRQSFLQLVANDQAQIAADKSRGPIDIFNEEFQRNQVPVFGLLTTLWNTYSRTVSSQASNLIGHDAASSAADYQRSAAAVRDQIANIQMSPAASRFRDAISKPVDRKPAPVPMSVRPDAVPMSRRDDPPMSTWQGANPVVPMTVGERLAAETQMFIDAATNDPGGAAAFMAETGLESIPQVFAAMAAGAATRSPVVAGSVLFGTEAATEAGTQGTEIVARKAKELGIDLSTRDGALAAISNPEIMRRASTDGWVRGLTVAAFDAIGFGVAGRALSRSPVGNFLMQSVVQALTAGGGEAAGSLAIGDPVNAADVITEALADGIIDTPVEMGGWAVTRFRQARANAVAAQGRKQFFEALSGSAQSSKLRNRMLEKFRDFVAKATENGPVENVFVPAKEFVTYFQGLSVDPFALVDELEGVTRDDLEIALAGGGDLRIPTATYAAKIAGSEHDAFLMDNMRFDPDQMTAREAAEFNAKADDALQEAWETAEDQRRLEEDFRSFEQEIYDTVVSRLRTAGRSTDEATTAAMLYVANYRTAAADDGVTIEEYMGQHPLPMVEGDLPQGMQLRNVNELNRSLAEARKRREVKDGRQSLLEFIDAYGGINDVGGELRSRNARTVKRQRGKRAQKLKIARGLSGMRDIFGGQGGKKFGASDVAQAAIDAGFMSDHPIVLAYQEALRNGTQVPDITLALYDAIDSELAGDMQHSVNEAPDADTVEHERVLDGIEEYLSRLNVSLDDDDATIRAAMEASDADGRKYAQAVLDRDATVPYLFQSAGPGPRGSIQFPAGKLSDGDTIIRLFQSANLSTGLHETGHLFLTHLQARAANGSAVAVERMDAVKSWWRQNAAEVAKDGMRVMRDVTITADDVIAALDNGTSGDAMKDIAIDIGMQEQWARGFEQYLMEGKAPSIELRSVFEKFRAWLISIYRELRGLNVTISDDMRRVFDRMLATDEEIANAERQAGAVGPVFATAEAMGLTDGEYAAFLKLRSSAEDEAKARLLRETMAPIRREREKAFRDERAKVREEVTRQVNAARYFRAIEWMGNRRWLGDGQPEEMPDIRLSKKILVDRYGAGILDTLPRGRQTVYAVDGGIDPDDAAGWFGFDSGDELVRAMEKAPKRDEAIKAETDRVMRERHGDALNDGSIEREALDAIHTDRRGEWIAAELKAINEVAGFDVGLTAKEARATARSTIARMRVRDAIADQRFLAAERKAGEEAERLAAQLARDGVWMRNAQRWIANKARAALRGSGQVETVNTAIDAFNDTLASTESTFTVQDQQRTTKDGREYTIKGGERTTKRLGYNDLVAELAQAKRRQLINHALYMEARRVADEVEKAERYVTKLGKKETRERIAGAGRRENAAIDYLAAIDEILDRYDFRKMSGRAEQRRGGLVSFVEAMKAAGRENELAIPDQVLADAARKPYKTVPVEELRGVIDSLKNLEHMAKRWDKLIDAQQQRALDEVVTDIVAAFDANLPKRPPGRVGTDSEAARNLVNQLLDLVLNAGTILREIDGFADMGAAYRNIKAPIDDAMSRLIGRKEKAAADLESLYSVYSADERRRMAVREFLPELGYSLSKWERIAVALNLGNEGNRQRLTDRKVRGSLTDDQVDIVLETLDERDADFVQSVWDYIDSFRADLAARERRTTGVEPKWVEATPVTIAGKTLRGGYYPIKYDPRLSAMARDDQANDIAQSLQAGRFGKAQTRNGHVKERAKSSGRDVELDMSVLHRHVNQVIYDLELSEAVSNSWRIIQNSQVRGAFTDAGRQADFDALEIWLKDVAEGELRSGDLVGRAARSLKSNLTAAKLALNLSTVAVQVTGLSQTIVVVGKRDFAHGVQASLRPGVAVDIAAKSPFMSTRQTTFNKDIHDFYNDPKMGPVASRWGDFKTGIIGPLSFWLMTKVQWHLVDVPTWLAGYHQGIDRFGGDEAKAVAHADAIVKRAQASGLFSDRSAVERGSVSRTARQNDVVRLFTALGSYMFAKFNVAYERTAVAGRTMRNEGVSARAAMEALSWTMDMAFLFTLEAVIIAAIKGRLPDDEDEEDDGWMAFLAKETGMSVLATIPFVRDVASTVSGFEGGGAYGAITKELAEPFKQMSQGEVDPGLVKAIINATGLATGIPSTQINRAVDATWRSADGEDVSPLEFILGRMGK